jgi:DNA-binding IclR family transcriptional regulator
VTADQLVAVDDFSAAVLAALLGSDPAASSVPRLSKALGRSASVVMRQLTLMGDVCGVGWVSVLPEDGRFMVRLTAIGLAVAHSLPRAARQVPA